MHVVSNHYIPEIFISGGSHLLGANCAAGALGPTVPGGVLGAG